MNAHRNDLGLQQEQANNHRWQAIGGLWRKAVQEYEYLIHDTMSGDRAR